MLFVPESPVPGDAHADLIQHILQANWNPIPVGLSRPQHFWVHGLAHHCPLSSSLLLSFWVV